MKQSRQNHDVVLGVFHEIVHVEMLENKSLPFISLVYWIRMYIHDIKNMIRTLAEIIHSLHPEYDIQKRKKLKKREDGWIWAP